MSSVLTLSSLTNILSPFDSVLTIFIVTYTGDNKLNGYQSGIVLKILIAKNYCDLRHLNGGI